MTPVRLEPAAPRSRVKHSTTEPLRSLAIAVVKQEFESKLFATRVKQDVIVDYIMPQKKTINSVVTVVPTKSESDVILRLQLLSKTLTCTLHLNRYIACVLILSSR